MKTKLINVTIMAALTGALMTGCAVDVRGPDGRVDVASSAEVEVSEPPPPAEVDIETASPGPDYVWIGGAWSWGGNRWNWERGHWDRPPHKGAVWVPHRYTERNGKHVFVRGGWK